MVDTKQQDTVRQGAEAVQTSARATSEAVQRGGEVAADTTRRSGAAGADVANRIAQASAETVRRGTQELAESQRQIVQNAAQQLEAVSRKVAEAIQGTQEDVRSLMTLPSAARGGLQDWQQGVTSLIQGVARTNLQATQELLRLANPGALVELQQRFVRQYLDTVIENSVTLVRAVRRTADETLGPLEQQLNQRQSARREYRQAAE
jgi:hypothetical protein